MYLENVALRCGLLIREKSHKNHAAKFQTTFHLSLLILNILNQ